MVIRQQIDFSGESSLRLEIDYAGGLLELEQDTTGRLADLELTFDREDDRPIIEYHHSLNPPTLKIRTPKHGNRSYTLEELRDNRWRIRLNPSLPIGFDIDAGAVLGSLDFTNLRVADLDLDIGAGKMDIAFGQINPERPHIRIHAGAATIIASGLCNSNFRSLSLESGAGKADLAFDGECNHRGEVDLDIGVGATIVRLSRQLSVKIRNEGSLLSSMSLHGFNKRGQTYYSENYTKASARLDFEIETGVGQTSIEWMD